MPSEERGGRWREGMREKDAEGRVRSRVSGGETRRERMKRRKGTKEADRGRLKGKLQTLERGESRREGERQFAG